MGIPFIEFLNDPLGIYVCARCKTCLSSAKLILSKNFQGTTGKAYLFKHVVNILPDNESTERDMMTGKHIVRDVRCSICLTKIGWYYDMAYNATEMYKEGSYVLEIEFLNFVEGFIDPLERGRDAKRSKTTSTDVNV